MKTLDDRTMTRTAWLNGKCKPEAVQAVKMILCMGPDKAVIGDLLRDLLRKLRKTELVDLYEWDGKKWYIEVDDEAIEASGQEHPTRMRLWFTVDLQADDIIWNHEGGNCGLRDRHWYRFMQAKYPRAVNTGSDYYHRYGFTPRVRSHKRV